VIFILKNKDYNKSYKEIFEERINNEENYKKFQKIYNHIKQDYRNKIRNKDFCIEIEKARLERNINRSKIKSVPNYISFALLATTVLVDGMITAYTQHKGIIDNYVLIIVVTIIFTIVIGIAGFSVTKGFVGEDKEVIVSKLCLRILDDDDIKKEIEKNKLENNIISDKTAYILDKQDKLDNILKDIQQIKEFLGIK
jgi:uncharacterized membrane protein